MQGAGFWGAAISGVTSLLTLETDTYGVSPRVH